MASCIQFLLRVQPYSQNQRLSQKSWYCQDHLLRKISGDLILYYPQTFRDKITERSVNQWKLLLNSCSTQDEWCWYFLPEAWKPAIIIFISNLASVKRRKGFFIISLLSVVGCISGNNKPGQGKFAYSRTAGSEVAWWQNMWLKWKASARDLGA